MGVDVVDTLAVILEDACESIQQRDMNAALRKVRIARGRLEGSVINRTSRLLYETMDDWAQITGGTIRVEVMVELLAQEGLLRDDT